MPWQSKSIIPPLTVIVLSKATAHSWIEKTSSAVPDFILGQYVIDDPAGIRSHPYSTSAYDRSIYCVPSIQLTLSGVGL